MKKYFVIFSSVVFITLIALFVWKTFKTKPYFSVVVITKDIHEIYEALKKIDDDCNILSVDNVINHIDFLTVEKFTGSEVGGLNIAYPKNWNGPYLTYIPVLQGKTYDLIKTEKGLFIVPGNGVKLPSGLIIGKDFELNEKSEIEKMMQKGGQLNFEGQALAIKIDFVIGDWDPVFKKKKKTIEEVKSMIDEFSEAMPFTKNEGSEILC